MLAVERRNLIKDLIGEQKSVIVTDLALRFQVTEETIRRDLKVLEGEGVLSRTYGGAYIQDGALNDISLSIRETILVESKETIAAHCKTQVRNGDSLYIDPSTTGVFVAEALQDMRLTVLSNSLKVINLLTPCPNIQLMAIGGRYSEKHMSFLGRGALHALEEYYVDKAFLSCRSLDRQHGITDSSEGLSELRRKILSHAREVYLIADHSKFDKVSFFNICGFEKITHLVTDLPLSPQWADFCRKHQIQLIGG